MHYKKIDKEYNLQAILIEMNHVISKYGWNKGTDTENQISLQSLNGKEWHQGTGTVGNKKETDYAVLNTPEHWELTKFIRENNLYRTRIMQILPKTCYSYHNDRTPRIHLAVITNPHCFLAVDKELFHIPADGHAYFVDTTKPHTAINCTFDFNRIHIVGCINSVDIL